MKSELRIGGTSAAYIPDPDWRQIQHVLLKLDGVTLDTVSLELMGKGSLVIGGGDEGRYMVVYFPENHPDLPSMTLTDPSLTGPDVELTIQTPARFAAKYAVMFPLVLQVVEHFFHTGEVPGDVRWELDTTKEEAINANRGEREGQQLGGYRLMHLLGRGSFAEVYLGQHLQLATQEAIKVLHIHLTGEEAESFQQEEHAICKLVHPHIMTVLDFGVQNGTPFLVMDFAPIGSLRLRHPNGLTVPLLTVIRYVKQVADALQYAHDQGFLHRDVKPENMLVGKGYRILLSDFETPTITYRKSLLNPQQMAGTIPHMAPEQIQGKSLPASDQYALGVVVYEWLCGACPFQGSPSEVIQQHLSVPPPSLRAKVPSLAPVAEEVVLKALAKDPQLRFVRVQEFALALEQANQTAR